MGVQDMDMHAKQNVVVVMVPFPAQGHLNQLLHLSRLVSSHNIPVHYVATATHSRQAKLRIQGWDPLSPDQSLLIHFHEFPTPAFRSPAPNPHASVKFPSHLQPSFDAALLLRLPVADVMSQLSRSAKRVVVIYDSIIPSVIQDVASIPNGEAYSFQSISTFCISSYYWEMVGKPLGMDDDVCKQIPSGGVLNTMTSEMMELVMSQSEHRKHSSGTLFNTCRAIEAPFLEVLAKVNEKQWAIGPFNPVELCKNSTKQSNYLDWLDSQAPNSVIYVSFGTTTSLTDEQIHAIAVGLENSGQKFIWVLRDADKGDIFVGDARVCQLPEGYEERIKVKGQGIILRGWAPQLEILANVSTGGFMSHCGWNSCMESMSMGVPLATWPMHSDQPHNALLVTKVLKIGVVVKDLAHWDELVDSLTIEKAVKELMSSKEGEVLRMRAVELGKAIKKSMAEGGDTQREFDGFIAHICR